MRWSISLWLFIIISCQTPDPAGIRFGAVATATPEASAIGMDILERGGNAIDAAIAISFALNVSEPAMSGIGGGCQIQIMLAKDATPFAINGSTFSPDLTPTTFGKDSLVGILRTTTPSLVQVLDFLYRNYGSGNIAWADLIQPSIDLAKEGLEPGPFRLKVYSLYLEKLEKGLPSTAEYFLDEDSGKWYYPGLAACFEEIAHQGVQTFYRGQIAQGILADMENHQGWIQKEDLQGFPEPEILPSIHFSYRGYDIYTQPEPAGGWIVQKILENLESEDLPTLATVIDAIHQGHGYRQTQAKDDPLSGETTHFSVLDASGMAISFTSSINAYYGAGIASEEYGFLYNSYMDDFNFEDEEDRYAIGPQKMAYSSMSPTMVLKEGELVMIMGSPGSSRIISTVAQLIHYYIADSKQDFTLLSRPRVHAKDGKVYLENPADSLFIDNSEYSIKNPSTELAINELNAYFGGVHAIVKGSSGYQALADPRRDGVGLVK